MIIQKRFLHHELGIIYSEFVYLRVSSSLMKVVTEVSKKINKPGVILVGTLTASPNAERCSGTRIPGLVLELAGNGEHLRLFVGNCDIDSQSKFLLSVAHAIFFLRPAADVLCLLDLV